MREHYRVRSVLASENSSALTLSPATWWHDSETDTIEVEGEQVPAWEAGEPSPDAEPEDTGGKMTEVRVEGESEFKPGDWVTLTLERSLP
jgi:hypothetical protein